MDERSSKPGSPALMAYPSPQVFAEQRSRLLNDYRSWVVARQSDEDKRLLRQLREQEFRIKPTSSLGTRASAQKLRPLSLQTVSATPSQDKHSESRASYEQQLERAVESPSNLESFVAGQRSKRLKERLDSGTPVAPLRVALNSELRRGSASGVPHLAQSESTAEVVGRGSTARRALISAMNGQRDGMRGVLRTSTYLVQRQRELELQQDDAAGPKTQTLESLHALLEEFEVNYVAWDQQKGGVRLLHDEVKKEVCSLEENPQYGLLRVTRLIRVRVHDGSNMDGPGGGWVLVERDTQAQAKKKGQWKPITKKLLENPHRTAIEFHTGLRGLYERVELPMPVFSNTTAPPLSPTEKHARRWNARPNASPKDDPHAWRDAQLAKDGTREEGYVFDLLQVMPMGFGRMSSEYRESEKFPGYWRLRDFFNKRKHAFREWKWVSAMEDEAMERTKREVSVPSRRRLLASEEGTALKDMRRLQSFDRGVASAIPLTRFGDPSQRNGGTFLALDPKVHLADAEIFEQWLGANRIDASRWVKSPNDLRREIEDGKCELEWETTVPGGEERSLAHGRLKRVVHVIKAVITMDTGEEQDENIKARHDVLVNVYKSWIVPSTEGGPRHVFQVLYQDLTEKVQMHSRRLGEMPQTWPACKRAIDEELLAPLRIPDMQTENVNSAEWIESHVRLLGMHPPEIEITESKGFPGLRTEYMLYPFDVEIYCPSPRSRLPRGTFFTTKRDHRGEGKDVRHLWQWMDPIRQVENNDSTIVFATKFIEVAFKTSRHEDLTHQMYDFLHKAARNGEVECVRWFLHDNPLPGIELDPYAGDQYRQRGQHVRTNALREAVLSDHPDSTQVVHFLVREAIDGTGALESAARMNEVQLALDDFGCSMLHYATYLNLKPMVDELLKHGSEPATVCVHSAIRQYYMGRQREGSLATTSSTGDFSSEERKAAAESIGLVLSRLLNHAESRDDAGPNGGGGTSGGGGSEHGAQTSTGSGMRNSETVLLEPNKGRHSPHQGDRNIPLGDGTVNSPANDRTSGNPEPYGNDERDGAPQTAVITASMPFLRRCFCCRSRSKARLSGSPRSVVVLPSTGVHSNGDEEGGAVEISPRSDASSEHEYPRRRSTALMRAVAYMSMLGGGRSSVGSRRRSTMDNRQRATTWSRFRPSDETLLRRKVCHLRVMKESDCHWFDATSPAWRAPDLGPECAEEYMCDLLNTALHYSSHPPQGSHISRRSHRRRHGASVTSTGMGKGGSTGAGVSGVSPSLSSQWQRADCWLLGVLLQHCEPPTALRWAFVTRALAEYLDRHVQSATVQGVHGFGSGGHSSRLIPGTPWPHWGRAGVELERFIAGTRYPVHFALHAVLILHNRAEHETLRRDDYLRYAANFEHLVVSMLDHCCDGVQTRALLLESARSVLRRRNNTIFPRSTPFWIAVQAEAKSVVAHNAFQEITALCWYQCPYAFDTTAGRDERALAIRELFESKHSWMGNSTEALMATDPTLATSMGVQLYQHHKSIHGKHFYSHQSDFSSGLGGSAINRSPLRGLLHRISPVSHAVLVASVLSLSLPLMTLYRVGFTVVEPFLRPASARDLSESTEFGCIWFKFFAHNFFYLGFLVSIFLAAMDQGDGLVTGKAGVLGLSVAECVMYGWNFTILLGLVREWVVVHRQVTSRRRTSALRELQLSWDEMVRPDYKSYLPTRVEFLSSTLFLIALGIKILNYDGSAENKSRSETATSIMSVVLALGGFGCCLRLLHISSIHHNLGPMWTAVNAMFADVKMFLFLLAVVILSFTCAFTFLLQYDGGRIAVRGFEDLLETLVTLFFTIFDPFLNYDPSVSARSGVGLGEEPLRNFELSTGAGHYGEFPLAHMVLLAVSMLGTVVVLLNLLIAMLNTTWSRISDEKDLAWKYVMVQVLVKYERVRGPPPPLNLVVGIAEILVYALTCCIGLCSGRGLRPWRRFAPDEQRENKLYSQIKAESEQHRERRMRLLGRFFSRRERELEQSLYTAWNAKEDLLREPSFRAVAAGAAPLARKCHTLPPAKLQQYAPGGDKANLSVSGASPMVSPRRSLLSPSVRFYQQGGKNIP